MKTMSKLSAIIVFGAAIASMGFAQQNPRGRESAPVRQAPISRQAPAPARYSPPVRVAPVRSQPVRETPPIRYTQPVRTSQTQVFFGQATYPVARETARPHTTTPVWANTITTRATTVNQTAVGTRQTWTQTDTRNNNDSRKTRGTNGT